MSAKIDCYVDCVSPFSHFAFEYLCKNRDILALHSVEIEFHPVFLSGILQATGNKPPLAIPAKGRYSAQDRQRAAKRFGLPNASLPPFFPINSILPQRCLVYVKRTYPREQFEALLRSLWVALFVSHRDISKREVLDEVLGEVLNDASVQMTLEAAGTPEIKQALTETTKKALDLGAFGAPYFIVTNAEGSSEPFFGSDRFHFMFDFLGIPTTLEVVEKPQL